MESIQNLKNRVVEDILHDYEKRISSRLHSLLHKAGLMRRIFSGDVDWGHHFNLGFSKEDSEEKKLKAHGKNIESMKKEVEKLKWDLIKYEQVVDARKKELDDG